MKQIKGVQLGAMLTAMLLLFVVFAITPANAYIDIGKKWAGTSAVDSKYIKVKLVAISKARQLDFFTIPILIRL